MFLHEGPPQSPAKVVVIENQPLEYFDGGGGAPPEIGSNGNSMIATALEIAIPVVAKVLGLEAPEEVAPSEKKLPTPEQIADILEGKHTVVSKIVPDLENGSAKRDFNKANPHDISFDKEDPESLILHQTARNHGRVAVDTLLALPNITRADVMKLAIDTIREIVIVGDTEVFHAIQLSKGLAEYRAKQFPYLDMFDAQDIDAFLQMPSYGKFLKAEAIRNAATIEASAD